MCPVVNKVTVTQILPLILPPVLPPLQLTPFLDTTGLAPIANQKWNGTEYVKIINKADFIVITEAADPTNPKYDAKLAIFYQSFHSPPVVNVIDIAANLTFNPLAIPYNFNVENSRAISNFGSSCYFNAALQYLFVMFDVRNKVVNSLNIAGLPNYIDPGAIISTPLINMYNDIKKLMFDMNIKPKTIPIPSTYSINYPNITQVCFNSPGGQQQDPHEFLTKYLQNFIPAIQQLFQIPIQQTTYHPVTSTVLSVISDTKTFFGINYTTIKDNPNATIENAMYRAYTEMELRQGTQAVDFGPNYDFGYLFYKIVDLPQYLNIHLNPFDLASVKVQHNIQINTTLTLTAGGKTINYFFLAVIVHQGNLPTSGHYTAFVFDNKSGPDFDYIYYDDDVSDIKSIPATTKIIPSHFYIKNPLATPYIILYGDITKLR